MNRQQEQRGREPRRHATDGSPSGGSNRISMRISPAATRSRAALRRARCRWANTTRRRESENVFEVCPAGGRHMPTPVWTRACACRNLRDPVCNFEKMVYARSPDPDPSMRVCHMASDRRHMYSQGPCLCAILSLTQLPSATAEPLHQARLPRSPSRSAVAGEPAAEPRAHPCTTGISLGEGRSAEFNYVQLCPIMSDYVLRLTWRHRAP